MAMEEKQEESELKLNANETNQKTDEKQESGDSIPNKNIGDATDSKDLDKEKSQDVNDTTESEPTIDNKEPEKMEESVNPDVTAMETSENSSSEGKPEEANKEKTDDWKIEASDEEDEDEVSAAKRKKGIWEPSLDVIVRLYEELDKKGVLELKWKCPGRKDLEEERREQEKAKEVVTEELVVPEEKEEEPTAFDDFEEDTTMVKITPRRSAGSDKAQGSGRKRTAKMESILGNMMRHQKIDEAMEKGTTDTEIDPMPKSDITPRRLGRIHIRNNIDS